MRSTLARCSLLCALALPHAACEEVPLEPFTDGASGIAAFDDVRATAPPPLSSEALLRAAVAQVHRERGLAAAQQLVAELRRLHDALADARRLGDRERVGRLQAAVRAEELRVVLHVFGDEVVDRTVAGVAQALELLRTQLRETNGDREQLGRMADEITALVDMARAAAARGEAQGALDFATRAALKLDAARRAFVAAHRIIALEELFQRAVLKVADERGREAAAALVAAHARLLEDARAAMRAGDRAAAQARLEAARQEQIRIVLAVFGTEVAGRVLAEVGAALGELGTAIEALAAKGSDVDPFERMLRSAAALLARSRSAHVSGNAASALDLASHAAGLLDALRLRVAVGR
jgi:hypothetical protein